MLPLAQRRNKRMAAPDQPAPLHHPCLGRTLLQTPSNLNTMTDIRGIGFARATFRIGLDNLVYNMSRG
jgi:hypothetical protein